MQGIGTYFFGYIISLSSKLLIAQSAVQRVREHDNPITIAFQVPEVQINLELFCKYSVSKRVESLSSARTMLKIDVETLDLNPVY